MGQGVRKRAKDVSEGAPYVAGGFRRGEETQRDGLLKERETNEVNAQEVT